MLCLQKWKQQPRQKNFVVETVVVHNKMDSVDTIVVAVVDDDGDDFVHHSNCNGNLHR